MAVRLECNRINGIGPVPVTFEKSFKKRIVRIIENNSHWTHFKDDTPNFQNLQKNQKSVENSLRKMEIPEIF